MENIKSQLEISTGHKKWIIEEQNKILIKLNRNFMTIVDLLFEFPDYGESNSLHLLENYFSNIRDKLSVKNLDLAHVVLFIENEKLIENIKTYYETLEQISKKKKEALNKLRSATEETQNISAETEKELSEDDLRPIDLLIQPETYRNIKKEYMDYCFNNATGQAWENYISSVREFLKSTDRQ